MEAAGRTSDLWLGRAFLLGFSDRWRYSLLGNANNVNETRHIGGNDMTADFTRRGYGSALLNTDDFVLNAFVSQPFLKGKLLVRIECFDLLHQLSSTRYEVNAQGRTATWYRSLPHYIMAHMVFHFNKNPKR